MLGPVFLDIGIPLFGYFRGGDQKNFFNKTRPCSSYLTKQLVNMIGEKVMEIRIPSLERYSF